MEVSGLSVVDVADGLEEVSTLLVSGFSVEVTPMVDADKVVEGGGVEIGFKIGGVIVKAGTEFP